MATSGKKDQDYIEFAEKYLKLAFELAYFIHLNKDMAFYVIEDACHIFEVELGQREVRTKHKPRGFLKGGEQSRPLRTKIWLSPEHTLQWLIYYQSNAWERPTERGDGLYVPTEEDMIVRFIKHLVQLTMYRSSFYVTLGVGRLLYTYMTPEVRRIYAELTKDEARYKDDAYLRRQKMKLMKEMLKRFRGMIQKRPQTTKKTGFWRNQPLSC